MGSAVPNLFEHGAKNLMCLADFLARVNGALNLTFRIFRSGARLQNMTRFRKTKTKGE